MSKVALPREWYRSVITHLVRDILPNILGPLTPEIAWRYVYACVMWAEPINNTMTLHILESDKLKQGSGRAAAARAAQFLSRNLTASGDCDPVEIIDQIGRARRQQLGATTMRRDPNVTGTAFETVLQVLIGELSGSLPYRTPSLSTLSGFELAPVGYHSRPDLILFNPQDFRLLISTKWTLRKERIGTYLHEAYFYKQRRPDLQVAFVVSDFNLNILRWLTNDPLADRVYHVNREMVLSVNRPLVNVDIIDVELSGERNSNLEEYRRWLDLSVKLFDLNDLFDDIARLRRPISPLSVDGDELHAPEPDGS